MQKKDLVEIIAKDIGKPQAEVKKVLDRFIENLSLSMKEGGKVEITGFGTFAMRTRKTRMCRDFRTGKEITIASKKVPIFRAGGRLKKLLK